MNTLLLRCVLSCAVLCVALPAAAQPAATAQAQATTTATPPATSPATATVITPPPALPAAPPEAPRGEPNVKYTVIEDGGSRIDELRVRGQTRRIVVTPKTGLKYRYELLQSDGSSGLGDNSAALTPHGNEGRRVWNVLAF